MIGGLGVRGATAVGITLAVFVAMGPAAFAAAAPQGPARLPPTLQARYQEITSGLRCPVCQNESIAVSQTRIAADLRRIVREKLVAGESNRQIRSYMISRYGLFAVYDPPLIASTWLLWFGPLILLLVAAAVALVTLRRRRRLLAASARPREPGRVEPPAPRGRQ